MEPRKKIATLIVFCTIAFFSLLSTVIVVKEGQSTGILLIPFIIGISLITFSIIAPKFGYLITIATSFFISDIERLIQVESLSFTVDVFIFSTFCGVLLNKLILRESFWTFANHPIIYSYIVYFFYTLLQIFNPNLENLTNTLLMIRKWVTLLIFFYCTLQLMQSKADIKKFLYIWFFFAFITALYGCLETWFGMPQYHIDFIFSNELLVGLYKLDDGDFRKFSFLDDPKEYGLLLAASAIIPIIYLVNNKYAFKKKMLIILLTTVLILGMSYSGTRTAYFMLVIAILFFILMTISNIRVLIFMCIFGLGLVFILYAPIYGNATINRLRSTFDAGSDASMLVRDINRKKIQPYILSHPIGGGLGTTGVLNAKNNPNHQLRGFPTDSGFLQAALEIGWIGLLIQCCVYFIIIRSGINYYYTLKNPSDRNLIIASTVAIFSYVAAQYSQVAIGDVPGIFLFYGLISIIIRVPQIEKDTLKK